MTLHFSSTTDAPESATSALVVVGLYEDQGLSAAAARIDQHSGGAITRLAESGDASGKLGSSTLLFGLANVAAPRVLVVGLGERNKLDDAAYHRAVNEARSVLKSLPIETATSYLTGIDVPGRDTAWKLRVAALAADQQAYRYTATFKPKTTPEKPRLGSIAFAAPANDTASEHALVEATAIAKGVRFARELGNLPPNICNPAWIAAQARHIADTHAGVSLEVLEREDMQKLGMGSLLGVSQGSAHPPKLIVLRWQGKDENTKPYALVGKGITFDSGGISLKPGAGMEEMKFDMCGGAGMLGTFLAAVEL